jgi:hypothetical protein
MYRSGRKSEEPKRCLPVKTSVQLVLRHQWEETRGLGGAATAMCNECIPPDDDAGVRLA